MLYEQDDFNKFAKLTDLILQINNQHLQAGFLELLKS